MMPEHRPVNGRLDSWKDIATYLGCDIRTAMRWEKNGLPVHRVPGGQRQAVFAYPNEIDEWLVSQDEEALGFNLSDAPSEPDESEVDKDDSEGIAATPLPGPHHRVLRYVILAAVAVAGFAFFWFLRRSPAAERPRVPVRVSFTANSINAFDEQDRPLWTHRFSKSINLDILQPKELVRIVDLKGDGGREVLVPIPLRMGPNESDLFQTEVDCFSSEGKLLWSYVPQETFRFGNDELGGPWFIYDLFVTSQGEKPAIWATVAHHRWGNSFVVQLDPTTGRDTVKFVNTGTLYKLNEVTTSAGTYLLAAGFNNEYAAGSLAVIDEKRPYAVSPQGEGTHHKCMSCPPGDPDYYFVFPRSEINVLRKSWEDSVFWIEVTGQDFEITKWELGDRGSSRSDGAFSYYRFHTQPSIQPLSLRFDSSYDLLHQDLEKQGKLNHALDACPERLHPLPVKVWTRSEGWTEVRIPPVGAAD
jgi:hypothetical protein